CAMSDLQPLEQNALAELDACADESGLQAWNAKYLGKAGELTLALKRLNDLPPAEKPAYGKRVNELQQLLLKREEERPAAVSAAALLRGLEEDKVDVTLPGRPLAPGRLHPATRMMRRILAIFADMGFQVYRSREVEDDLTNFELLNMPPHHPARDL